MKNIRTVVSFFDGIGTGRLALQEAGINPERYIAFEIDPFAIRVAKGHFPDIEHKGDANYWEKKLKGIGKVDLVIGGFPCQSFSKAGSTLGFKDPRGKLFYLLSDAIKKLKPSNFFTENVMMREEFINEIEANLGVKHCVINSEIILPAKRNRLYWTSLTKPYFEPNNKTFDSIREHNVNKSNLYYSYKALQYLGRSVIRHKRKLKIWDKGEKFETLTASHSRGYSKRRFWAILDHPLDACMEDKPNLSRNFGNEITFKPDPVHSRLLLKKDKYETEFTKEGSIVNFDGYMRYITVKECCRCMGFPDSWLDSVSKTQGYKLIGNSWSLPIIVGFFKNI